MAIVTKVRYPNHQPAPFSTYTQMDPVSRCIEWIGHRYPLGYGRARLRVGEPREVRAHRRAWEMAYGEIPKGLHVLHKCDNPPCCNPEHLFLGTDLDNTHDKYRKRRNVNLRGELHGMAKVGPADVRRIREAALFGATYADLGRAWGLTDVAVSKAVRRETWAHLE